VKVIDRRPELTGPSKTMSVQVSTRRGWVFCYGSQPAVFGEVYLVVCSSRYSINYIWYSVTRREPNSDIERVQMSCCTQLWRSRGGDAIQRGV